jgi:bacterioferritin-associated ferredoxin
MNEFFVDLPRANMYFMEAKRVENEIQREILEGRHPHQPKPTAHTDPITGNTVTCVDHVFICSRRSLEHRTTAGAVCGATVKLAAQKIVEGSHQLATAEELAAWYERQRQQREFNEAEDERHDRTRTFKVKFPAGEGKS